MVAPAAGGVGVTDAEHTIDAALRRLVHKRRRVLATRAAIVGVSVACLWLLAAMVLDRWAHFIVTTRVGAMVVFVSILMATAWRAGRRLLGWRFDAAHAARLAEAGDKAWDERLSTCVTQTHLPPRDRGSFGLNASMATEVAGELTRRPPADRVRLAAARPALSLMATVVVLWLVALVVPTLELPRLAERQLLPWRAALPVTSTRIDLLPHPAAVAQGQSLAIVADLNEDVEAVVMHVGTDANHLKPFPMTRTSGQRYTLTLLAPQEDFVYRVTAGDATAGPVNVRVRRKPGVVALDVTLTFPDGRSPPTLRDTGGDLRVPAGTRVNLSFRASEPLRSATVRVSDETRTARSDAEGRMWQADFVATHPAKWGVSLVSRRNVRGTGPSSWRVRVDSPPATRPGEAISR